MCGLFAGVGKLNSNRIIALGSMNEDRGTDSVGLAYLDKGTVTIAKVAERPCVALNVSLRKAVTEAAISGVFIGHTRQATQGSVTSRNAHPFLDQGIAFAHNGIIINDHEFGKYEVDSESLIHGIKGKDFSKYEGCIALVWIEEGKLKAFRCGNPLYRGRHNGSTYLASDKAYLASVGCTSIKELSEGLIYTFHNATQLTTERVKKNKSFGYLTRASKLDDLNSIEDYLACQRGAQYKLDAPLLSEGNVKEDFRTAKDIAKESNDDLRKDYCDMCGSLGELTEGICLECITWMDDQGIASEKDLPPQLKVH